MVFSLIHTYPPFVIQFSLSHSPLYSVYENFEQKMRIFSFPLQNLKMKADNAGETYFGQGKYTNLELSDRLGVDRST